MAARTMTVGENLGLLGMKGPLEVLPRTAVTLHPLLTQGRKSCQLNQEPDPLSLSCPTFNQVLPGCLTLQGLAPHFLWTKSKFLSITYKNLCYPPPLLFCLISVCILSPRLGAAHVEPRWALHKLFTSFLSMGDFSLLETPPFDALLAAPLPPRQSGFLPPWCCMSACDGALALLFVCHLAF